MIKAAAPLILAATLLAAFPGPSRAADDTKVMPDFPSSDQHEAVVRWVRDNTHLPISPSTAFTSDSVMAITGNSIAGNSPTTHKVTFREEATQIDFVSRMGGRSVQGVAEVDCPRQSVRISSLVLYAGTDLRGDHVSEIGPEQDWRTPSPNSVLSRVVGVVCGVNAPGRSAPRTLRPDSSTMADRSSPTQPSYARPSAQPSSTQASAAQASSTQGPATQAPAAQPSAAQAAVASAAFARPAARPDAVATTPLPSAQPAPPPDASADAALEPAPPPERLARAAPSRRRAAPAAPAKPTAESRPDPTAPGAILAQIGAYGSSAMADKAWEALAAKLPDQMAGRSKYVELATVNGAPFYRALVGGFSSRGAAQALCRAATAKGQACFVRQ